MPLEIPFWWTPGYCRGASKAIVELETHEGIVGVGEAPSTNPAKSIEAGGERLTCMDITDVVGCEALCGPAWQYIDVIEGGPFHQTDDHIRVPEGPWLGSAHLSTRRT